MGDHFKRLTRRLALKVGTTVTGGIALAATGLAQWLAGCGDDTSRGSGSSGYGSSYGNGSSSGYGSSLSGGYGSTTGYGMGWLRPFRRLGRRV